MRFVVDAQLPPALARFLASLGEEAIHVLDAGLLEADDGEIWSFALQKLLEIFKKYWAAIKHELEAGAFLVEVV